MEIDSELRSKDTWLISEDGLWDISIGLVILGWGLTTLLRHPIWFISFVMLAYFLVVMTGKEVITRPRMAYFSITEDRLIQLSKWIRIGLTVIISGLIIGAVTFWIFDISATISRLPVFGVNLFCLILSMVMILLGYLSNNGSRYYLYAGIAFLAFIIFEIVGVSSLTIVFSAALVFAISGIGFLLRFINRYPKSKTHRDVQY